MRDIPIEQRAAEEITHLTGLDDDGQLRRLALTPPDTAVSNFGFDVTPARLVSGLITEKGIFPATPEGLIDIKAWV